MSKKIGNLTAIHNPQLESRNSQQFKNDKINYK